MSTCSTCRFFGAQMGVEIWDDDYDAGYGFGPGDTHETDHHACARIIHGNGIGSNYKTVNAEPAIVTDGSGYAARLRVLPTFGCALHEER
jgi:hypothetical protein